MKPFVRVVLCLSHLLMPLAAFAQNASPPAAEAPETVITVTQTANLRRLADTQGYDGHSAATFLFVVPANTVILGKQGGGTGIDTGQWPEGVELALIVRGHVYGGGGNGADGGDTPMVRDGGRGGDAIFVQAPIAIAITRTGSVKAGGGGGAGADGLGSGGGGGFPNGKGGEGGSAAVTTGDTVPGLIAGNRGYYGTPGGGGQGGQRGAAGGYGGNAGQAGQSLSRPGGGEGFAIRTNGHEIVLDNKGQMIGQTG